MEYVKLGDIAKIVAGSTAPKENQFNDNIGLPFIRAGHLEDLCNNYDLRKLPKIDENNKNIKKQVKVPKNTIIFAKSGMSCMKSRVYQTTEECYIVNHLAGVICSENVNPSYLKYYFMVNKPNRLIVDESYPSIRLSDISNMDIYLPNLDTQQKIAEVLDKAQELIDKRKEQIEVLDELVKSRFIEMFGKGDYQIVKTEDICEFITKGTTPKSNEIFECYTEGFIPYLKVYNLSFDGTMLFNDNPQYVTRDTHNGFLARSKVFPNDVLMNIVGPPLGKFSLVPSDFDEWNINQAIAIFRATDKVKPIYLLHALKQPNVLRPFIDSAVGVRQQNISLSQCRNIEIALPPIELQNEFADFVKQVDKLKSQMETSLKELEDNFNSLMQKAFKGELF